MSRSSVWLCLLITLVLCVFSLQAQGPPRTPIVERRSCPFECCRLGQWAATDTTRVYDRERASGPPVFLLLPNQRFLADSANLHTLELGVVVLRQPIRLADYLAEEGHDSLTLAKLAEPLASGDTVYHVGHEPETGEVVWAKGMLLTVGWFWAEHPRLEDYPDAPAVLVRALKQEWWVRITREGRTGWIQAFGAKLLGADACGSPLPPDSPAAPPNKRLELAGAAK